MTNMFSMQSEGKRKNKAYFQNERRGESPFPKKRILLTIPCDENKSSNRGHGGGWERRFLSKEMEKEVALSRNYGVIRRGGGLAGCDSYR